MASKRAKTPNKPAQAEPTPHQRALQQILQELNQDPGVLQAMNESLMRTNAQLLVQLEGAQAELEELKKKIPQPKKATSGKLTGGGSSTGSEDLDQTG